jgi:DNA-binding response OmpR family regulator
VGFSILFHDGLLISSIFKQRPFHPRCPAPKKRFSKKWAARGTIFAFKGRQSISSNPAHGMSTKRILLINDDRLLLKLYREKLEEQSFVVDAVRELELAQKSIKENRPDAVLLDLVCQSGNAFDFIKEIRADASTANLPVLILPSVLARLGEAGVLAGATAVIAAGDNPLGSIVDAAKRSLGLDVPAEAPSTAAAAKPAGFFERLRLAKKSHGANGSEPGSSPAASVFKRDDFWGKVIISNSVEAINEMRHCLPGLSVMPPELPALHNLWNLAHAFSVKAGLLWSKPLAQLAGALDVLLHDLNESPEQVNPSTVRTVGQALDFLSTITKPESMERLTDPSGANLLVVDDEDSAREFISMALQLAGLNSDCAASPSRAIEKLEQKPADLIFLDVGLPEMNGFELCTKIRAVEAHKTTPIVFITGMATFQNKAKASLSGGNDFVGKPFNLPELGLKALIWLFRKQLQPA